MCKWNIKNSSFNQNKFEHLCHTPAVNRKNSSNSSLYDSASACNGKHTFYIYSLLFSWMTIKEKKIIGFNFFLLLLMSLKIYLKIFCSFLFIGIRPWLFKLPHSFQFGRGEGVTLSSCPPWIYISVTIKSIFCRYPTEIATIFTRV